VLLSSLEVLSVDCQASGATPAHGDLLELGWAFGPSAAARAYWIVPGTDRPVSSAVRKLTGWSEDCLADAIEAADAWAMLRADAPAERVPTVIHFARFELPFLRALHESSGDGGPFPLDTVCLHAIAQRLFPDLPRRNMRALAGHLGHSPELIRRARGHVEATASIWRALIPRLAECGVHDWDALHAWLEQPAPRPAKKRGFPLSVERRRALPNEPGVYRFLRSNGDVLYVGKAANLKKRVASHLTAGARSTERALEMLSQAHEVATTTTASVLEAALLESDEIKRLDPPYNVQLRSADRHAWFASADWMRALPAPDADHRVGPLPSSGALASLAAVRVLLEGAPTTEALRGAAVGVPARFAPDAALFDRAWRGFIAAWLDGGHSARARILDAAARIEPAESPEESEPVWDEESVRRYLERTVFGGGLLVRRARALSLLVNSVVAFREPGSRVARLLELVNGEIVARRDVDSVTLAESLPSPPSRHARQLTFDATRYDRLRVLTTELRRIREQGGEVAVRVGCHLLRSSAP